MNVAMIVVLCIVALIVVGVAVFEIVGWMVERKARERFEKMTPEEQRKYQEDMHKAQTYHNS